MGGTRTEGRAHRGRSEERGAEPGAGRRTRGRGGGRAGSNLEQQKEPLRVARWGEAGRSGGGSVLRRGALVGGEAGASLERREMLRSGRGLRWGH